MYMSIALQYLRVLLGSVVNWLNQIYSAIPGSVSWVLAVFAMYCSFRFLLFPLAGGRAIRGSDTARRSGSSSTDTGKGQRSDPFGDGIGEYYYDR